MQTYDIFEIMTWVSHNFNCCPLTSNYHHHHRIPMKFWFRNMFLCNWFQKLSSFELTLPWSLPKAELHDVIRLNHHHYRYLHTKRPRKHASHGLFSMTSMLRNALLRHIPALRVSLTPLPSCYDTWFPGFRDNLG